MNPDFKSWASRPIGFDNRWHKMLPELFDEVGVESEPFKLKIRALKIEEQTIELNRYPIYPEPILPEELWDMLHESYFYIDANIYQAIAHLLKECSMEDSLNDICFITKYFLYEKILFELNRDTFEQRTRFNADFFRLYKILSEDITAVKFQTNKVNAGFKTDEPSLVKLLLLVIKQAVFNNESTPYHLADLELNIDRFKTTGSDYVQLAIFNLHAYLQIKTAFSHNNPDDKLTKQEFTDKQLELVYEILTAANVIDDTQIDSPAKTYIRTKLKRFYKNYPQALEFVTKKGIVFNPPDDPEQSDRDYQNLVKQYAKNLKDL